MYTPTNNSGFFGQNYSTAGYLITTTGAYSCPGSGGGGGGGRFAAMVKQDICGVIKYDTVVVYASATGNEELKNKNEVFKINPNPAGDYFELSIDDAEMRKRITFLYIYNSLGQIVHEEKLIFNDSRARINTHDLSNGVYLVTIKNANEQSVTKKLIINN